RSSGTVPVVRSAEAGLEDGRRPRPGDPDGLTHEVKGRLGHHGRGLLLAHVVALEGERRNPDDAADTPSIARSIVRTPAPQRYGSASPAGETPMSGTVPQAPLRQCCP